MASRYIDAYELVTGVVDMSTAVLGQRESGAFIVGSDGLERYVDGTPPRTNVRKIFELVSPGVTMVYAILGNPEITDDTTNEVVLNFPKDIKSFAGSARDGGSVLAFAKSVSRSLNEVLLAAHNGGRIASYPLPEGFTTVLFAGFINGIGEMVEARFSHVGGVLQEPQIVRGDSFEHGSIKVAPLIGNDKRIPFDMARVMSAPNDLERTVEVIKGRIDAYGCKAAHEIDPANCEGIGGMTQVCVVRPGGIEWKYGPASGDK
jgi:hypothetical protein